jgi:hypothetical protein
MNLLELFRRLSYGELSNLAIGSNGVGVIAEDGQPKIVTHANETLLRLHSRFLLRENLLFLRQVDHLTYYYLLKRFARSEITDPPCPNAPHAYILDNADEPFEDDLIKVLEVMDQDGCKLPLNDAEDPRSLYTPQPNLLQIPEPLADRVLSVNYQARHPILTHTNVCQEIDLPFALEGALTAHIAYQVYSNMNGQENSGKAAEHLARYESVCNEIQEMDIVSQSRATTTLKFHDRGFR